MSSRSPALAFALVAAALAAPSAVKAAALPPPTVMITSPVVNEGDAGMTMFKAQVTYQIYGSFGGASTVEVDIDAMPGTATAPDFVFAPVHLTLTAGTAAQEITGYVLGDKVYEGDETFTLVARTTTGGYIWNQGGVVTITDDDQTDAPMLSIDPTTTVPEGNGPHTVGVQVRLKPAVMREVSVVFGTTSSDPTTFKGTMGVLKFAPGQTAATIPVDVIGNSYWNIDRTFTIGISQPQGALIGSSVGTVVMANDDAATVLSMSDVTVVEGTGGKTKVNLEIHLSPPAPPNSKIWLTVAGGAAKWGEDYEGNPFQVLYPQGGETVMRTSFDIVGDAVHECSEGLVLKYQAVYMGDDTARTAKLLITDDDDATGPVVAGCVDPYSGPPPVTDPGTPPPINPDPPTGDVMGVAGAPGNNGMAGTGGDKGFAGAPGTAGTGSGTGTGTGSAGATGKADPGAMNDRLSERGGCSIAPAGAPGSGFEALVWLGLALAAVKLRRAVRARLY